VAAPAPSSGPRRDLLFATLGFGSGTAGAGYAFGVAYHHREDQFGLDLEGSTLAGSGGFSGWAFGELQVFSRPDREATWFYGAGLGVGGMADGAGFSAHATFGYQFDSSPHNFGSFLQASYARPLYDLSTPGGRTPAPPTLIFSFGVGHDIAH
jgi:hypothetical protein